MAKHTPLYHHHQQLDAKLVDFAGWQMPVAYPAGTIAEHKAVRTAAGLFDVSHMGEFEVRGAGATHFLQQLTCNDVARLRDGDAQYSLLLNEHGGIIDDIIIYRKNADHFLIVVNAGNLETDWHWILAHREGEVKISNLSDATALLAIQGPLAEAILQPLCDRPLSAITRFTCREVRIAGLTTTVARTGYTGEDGFEIFVEAASAANVWATLLEAGRPKGLLPCGLGARDTLRLEMAYPLHGHDITDKTTPLETRLGWVVKLEKGPFMGRERLQAQKTHGVQRQLVGLQMIDPGIPREEYPLIAHGKPIGYVTSGTMSPMLKKGIGLGFVPPEYAGVGNKISVDIRGNERVAEVVKLPFYQPKTS